MIACELCKREFSEMEGQAGCSSCAIAKGCRGVRCPYCYYEMVPKPPWLRRLDSFLSIKLRAKSSSSQAIGKGILVLTSLAIGQDAWVNHLDMESNRKLEELIAIGVLPGRGIRIIQKFPSFVFQVGYSQFSIDQDLASCIYVNSNPHPKEEHYEV